MLAVTNAKAEQRLPKFFKGSARAMGQTVSGVFAAPATFSTKRNELWYWDLGACIHQRSTSRTSIMPEVRNFDFGDLETEFFRMIGYRA